MPYTCLVVGCGSRSNREKLGFYSVPAITSHRFLTDKNELSRKRRALWIAAIKRDDLTDSKLKNQKVCSKHFITGKPADLEDENHPDWVPSQNMGHTAQNVLKRQEDVERKERLEKRRKLHNPEVHHLYDKNHPDYVSWINMECKPLDKRFKQKNDDVGRQYNTRRRQTNDNINDSIRVKSEHNAKTIYQKGTDMSKISPIVVLKKNYQGTKEIADIPKVSSICQKGTDIPKTSPIIVPEKNLQDNIGISYVPKVSTDRKKGTDITKMSPLVALKINVQDKTGTKISTVGTVGQKGTHMSRMLPKVVLKKTCTGTNDIPKVYTRAKTLQKGKNIYRKKTDIFNMCRVCLTQNPKTMYDLIEDFTDSCNKEISIIDALQTVTSTTIIIHPKYPQYICPMCLSMLKMAHEFILNFKKSLMQLEKTGAFGDDIGNKKKVVMNVEDTENWESNKNELLSDDNRDFEGRGESETQFNSLSELGREITEKLRRQLKMKGDIDSEIIIGKAQEADDNWKSGKVELIIEEEEFDTTNSDDEEDEGILEGHNLHDDDKITILMEEGNDEQTLRKKVKVASDEYKTVPDLEDTNCGETGRCDDMSPTDNYLDKMFSCDRCGRSYGSKQQLTQHMSSHLLKKKFLCNLCGERFYQKNGLSRHMILHTYGRRYQCPYCAKLFSMESTLQRHERTHTGKISFQCKFCDEEFRTKNERSVHESVHTGFKPYVCRFCHQGFTMPSNFKAHLFQHSGPYDCNICDKNFFDEHILQLHRKQAHGTLLPDIDINDWKLSNYCEEAADLENM